MRWADMNKVEYLGLLFAFLAFIASVISVVVDFKGFMASIALMLSLIAFVCACVY